MRNNISKALFAIAIVLTSVSSVAQTLGPSALRASLNAGDQEEIDTLYKERPPMILGWNWGGALLGVNDSLRINTWHVDYPFTWIDPFEVRIWDKPHRINAGGRMLMAPSWQIPPGRYQSINPSDPLYSWYSAAVLIDTNANRGRRVLDVGHGGSASLCEANGMRFHPELDLADTNDFTPRAGDQQRAVWGFLTRDTLHGSIETDSTAENFHRYVLDDTLVTGWTTVLNSSWPQQQFCEWRSGNALEAMRSFNGHLMYLNVHLRRTDDDDTLTDQTEVLRLTLHYQLDDGSTGDIRFDSLPATTGVWETLPDRLDGTGRGLKWPLADRVGLPAVDEMVITRNMLPLSTSAEPDVTVQAHFGAVRANNHGISLIDQNWLFRDRFRLGHVIDASKDEDRIIRLWIEVEYNGESDIAIDWIEIGTENYTWFTQGYYDEVIQESYIDMADSLTHWNNTVHNTAGDSIGIWLWYNRDEGPPAYWNGMSYMHELFDSRTTSEVGFLDETEWYIDRYIYGTGITEIWEGHSARISNLGISPYYADGHQGEADDVHEFYYHKWGRHSTPWSLVNDGITGNDTVDYDTYHSVNASQALPLTLATTPTATDDYPTGINRPGEGLQSTIEYNRYLQYRDGDYLFRDDVNWMPNYWLSADYKTHVKVNTNPPAQPDTIYANESGHVRHMTGEEIRLLSWSEIILGAKGLIYYYGPGPDSVVDREILSPIGTEGYQVYGMSYGPAVHPLSRWVNNQKDTVWRDPLGSWQDNIDLAEERTDSLNLYGARNPGAGKDWSDDENSTGLWHAMEDNTYTPAIALDNLYGTLTTGEYYVGSLSQRSAAQSVNEVLQRGAHALDSLRLRTWYHRGYRTWTKVQDSAQPDTLDLILDKDSIKTRHPFRDPVTRSLSWEPIDSSFVELTLLKDHGVPLSDTFYLGVLNRRASPLLYDPNWSTTDPNHTDLSTFITYQEQYHHIDTASDKSVRYRQAGSRTVEIPFSFDMATDYRNLHVVGVGMEDEESQGIVALDTVIGQDSKLRLDLMPGQGMMLKVWPVEVSTVEANRGYLDHTNQRKMVAFPKVDSFETVTDPVDSRTYYRQTNGDTTWYHRVYHRRPDRNVAGTADIGFLSVFYQRSEPLVGEGVSSGNNALLASQVTWESEVLISDSVRLINGLDTMLLSDLSCGYPSLVARIDTLDALFIAKVYVVFACEHEAETETTPQTLLICERVIPAQVTAAERTTYLAGVPGEALAEVPAPTTPYLEHWGTPMINASSSGNYYCWSHGTQGIGVGYKTPNAPRFAAGQVEYIAMGDPATDVQAHPSLNSYSRLHIGEEDAALVWQVGQGPEWGSHIYYTRLKHDALDNIYHELTASAIRTVVGPTILTSDPDIAEITDSNIDLDSTQRQVWVRNPVVYRHLSDWDMDSSALRFEQRQVNHKAERILWEADIKFNAQPNVIGRRNVDVAEWSINTLAVDTIWSQTDNYIFSDSLHLRGPDIAQGEQIGEPQGNPADSTYWHEDSTIVVEFWSDTSEIDANPLIWNMTHGYTNFYGQDYDHDHADLTASGMLRPIQESGRYTHLAARYSMYAHEGWQRNRRFFSQPGGDWSGAWSDAPSFVTSSQYFFKGGNDQIKTHGYVYRGVRSRTGDALLGPVWIESQNRWVGASIVNANDGGKNPTIATPWIHFESIDDITVMTKAWSDEDVVGTLFLERKSDGTRLNMNAVFRNQNGKVKRMAHTLLSDPKEHYRFILEPGGEDLYNAEDVEITIEHGDALAKSVSTQSIIDLRSMGGSVDASDQLTVYPNPARDELTVVVNLQDAGERSNSWETAPTSARVRLFSLSGGSVLEQECMLTDVIRLNVGRIPTGVYTVQVSTSTGTVLTKQVSVVH